MGLDVAHGAIRGLKFSCQLAFKAVYWGSGHPFSLGIASYAHNHEFRLTPGQRARLVAREWERTRPFERPGRSAG